MHLKKLVLLAFLLPAFVLAQSTAAFADSIRKTYAIPELAFAVVSSTKVLELQVLGYKKINSTRAAEVNDKFRIGSNTKAITGLIAALLVKEGKITWQTKFFDLFPELKANSLPVYHELTLLNLLSFRTRLKPYTYTNDEPKKEQFTGDEAEQRYQFTQWFFQQAPVRNNDSLHVSNVGYTAAGMMLEKVSGKPYKQLVTELGKQLGIQFGFGAPNVTDTLQPWGHNKELKPQAPGDNYKLNWLLPAGNINVSLPDYVKFLQLQLAGLKGESELLRSREFNFLHYGLKGFAIGWFWGTDAKKRLLSYNAGNPGTFLAKVYVYKNSDRAIVIFTNVQSDKAGAGIEVLFNELYKKYVD